MIIAFRNRTGVDLYLAKSVDESSIRFTITTTPPKTRNRKEARLIVRVRKGADYGVTSLPEGLPIEIVPKRITLAIKHSSETVPSADDTNDVGTESFQDYTLRFAN